MSLNREVRIHIADPNLSGTEALLLFMSFRLNQNVCKYRQQMKIDYLETLIAYFFKRKTLRCIEMNVSRCYLLQVYNICHCASCYWPGSVREKLFHSMQSWYGNFIMIKIRLTLTLRGQLKLLPETGKRWTVASHKFFSNYRNINYVL